MKYFAALLIITLMITSNAFSQDTIMPLWPKDKIPNRIDSDEKEVHVYNDILRIQTVQEPTIEVYLPSKKTANGQAMLIFPGGGYGILAYDWEGTDMAKFLNSKGIAGIVVKYRLPSEISQKDKHNVPLIDVQRAIRMVRSNASAYNVDPNKIGIMGFSAGGHLASTLGTHFNEKVYQPIDAIDNLSARPDFMALIYPVITFTQSTKHSGSEKNLLGEKIDPKLEKHFSNELQVTSDTPTTLLIHAADDTSVPVANSILFFEATQEKGVEATMHIYPKGGHGFGLARDNVYLRGWTERMFEWLENLD
ncbi:alpha/beta hydrolase [Aurantibacter crassamenti]|uniref:alpha/beta hydrolase n=1 Tax=Aurantibacter crassamenti TaxID=1837375 RepID=UPI00193A9EFC|nr:alpha/beta hydrolase [Aurantibacter crassamenti]MBM1107715.1 alpha/beta hydrolase [Aurantibacter crassamenti]